MVLSTEVTEKFFNMNITFKVLKYHILGKQFHFLDTLNEKQKPPGGALDKHSQGALEKLKILKGPCLSTSNLLFIFHTGHFDYQMNESKKVFYQFKYLK